MIDGVKEKRSASARRTCAVLGFRRQTYCRRRQGHRPEEEDGVVADLLHQVTRRFVCWGFGMVFHFLRRQNHPWNHKRVYRIWKEQGLNLRIKPNGQRSSAVDGSAPLHLRQGADPSTGHRCRLERLPGLYPLRQRAGVHLRTDQPVGKEKRRGNKVYPSWQTKPKWADRTLERYLASRVPEPGMVPKHGRIK